MLDNVTPQSDLTSVASAGKRRRMILQRARVDGHVRVARLAQELDVAAETVRRDLQVLADQGLLRRNHGGAIPVDTATFENTLPLRSHEAAGEKARIAAVAVRLLGEAGSVFVDEGSTATAVAHQLSQTRQPLTVVTHSLPVAATLAARPATEVLVLGGQVRSAAMATVGVHAIANLADLTVDIAFLSASGISLTRGASTSYPETAEFKRVAMASARRTVFVGAHTKFGVTSFCRYAAVADFDVLITDSGLPGALADRYRSAGPRLLRA